MQTSFPSQGATALVAFSLAALSIAAYFSWSAIGGNSGRMERVNIDSIANEKGEELQVLSTRRKELENKVQRLSDDQLDLDLLDEQLRRRLHMARTDETILFHYD